MSVQNQIWSWAKQLRPWQSDLLRRLWASIELSDAEIEECTRIVSAEFGALDADEVVPIPVPTREEHLPQAALNTGSVRISSLSSLENVGALEPGQKLVFELRGLTAVYGDNGAGKSSYARVLKEACRASDRSTKILPNVFVPLTAGRSTQGTAKFEINEGGVDRFVERTTNTPPLPVLSSVSVFDSGCADVYLSGPSAIAYVPQALVVFKRLADAQEKMSVGIQSKIDEVKSSLPQFLDIAANTKAKAWLDGLSEKTDQSTIKEFVTISVSQQSRLAQLEADLKAVRADESRKVVNALLRKASEAEKVKLQLESLCSSLTDAHVSDLKNSQEAVGVAQTAVDVLAQKVAAEGAIAGLNNPVWKSLWAAANSYCNAAVSLGDSSPMDGSSPFCPLCRQSLSAAAQQRFQKIQELTSGLLEKELLTCQASLAKRVEWLNGLPSPANSLGNLLFGEHPTLNAEVSGFLSSFVSRKESLKSALGGGDWGGVTKLLVPPVVELRQWIEEVEAQARELERLAQPAERASAERELLELKAHSQLVVRIDDVVKYVEALRKIQKLEKARSALSTKSITTVQTKLIDTVVTEELRKCLDREVLALDLEHLQVKMSSRGVKGKTVVELQLDAVAGHKIGEVLSEGETRALTLAFFLAEVSAGAHDGGVIFDDPVSSLDHARREYVAQRLSQEASRRQVIVFTHDIVFLSMLRRHAEGAGVRFREQVVRRSSGKVGVADSEVPWKAMSCEKQQSYLRNKLPDLTKIEKSGNADKYSDEAKNWLGMLRSSWERAVEDKILGGVVSRFSPEVHTKKLASVKVTEDLIKAVNDGMTMCSNWVHDQSLAINAIPPKPKELEGQLNKYKDFLDVFK